MRLGSKNYLKISVTFVFIVFLFSLFKAWRAFCASDILTLENISVLSKPDTLEEGSIELVGNKISVNDLRFHQVGDYINYSVKIRNDRSEDYIVKSVSDDNKNEYISYAYDGYDGKKINSGDTFDFVFMETYSKELKDISQRYQNFTVNFYLVLENERGDTFSEKLEVGENPPAGDNIGFYVFISAILFVVSMIVIKKINVDKVGKNRLGLFVTFFILYFAFMPQVARSLKADTFKITLDNSLQLKDKLIISYDIDGTLNTEIVPYNAKLSIEKPNKKGYVFKGWRTEGGNLFSEDTPIRDDMNLRAVFEPESYKISYDLNGGTADNPESYTIEDEIRIANPSRMGYSFEGWTGTGISELKKDLVIEKGSFGNRTYEAHWIAAQYTVIFDKNGGDGYMDNKTFEYDVPDNLPKNLFVKDDAVFTGWNTMADGSGESYADEAIVKNLASEGTVTLYAQWGKIDRWAMFIKGSDLNVAMKKFAGNGNAGLKSEDNQIIAVLRSYEVPPEEFMTAEHIVSVSDSPDVIYMWYNERTVYYYSAADYVYLNPMSKGTFEKLLALKNIDTGKFRTDKVTDMSEMFYNCTNLENIDLSSFITKNVTNMFGMFGNCKSLQNLDLRSFNTSSVTDMSSMFNQCNSVASIDVRSFDTSNVEDMNRMFTACTSLESLNLSGFRTQNVKNMEKMFDNIPLIQSINLSAFDTSNVTKMNGMFRDCSSLNSLDLSNFNTGKVNTMQQMFYNCHKLGSVNLSGFDTSSVTDMSAMFSQCHSIGNLNLSGFDTHNVRDMSNMFNNCNSVTSINVSNFDTSFVENMSRMFSSCSSVRELDVSNFNTHSVVNMEKMFDNMSSLTTIYAGNNFNVYNLVNGYRMFINDINLVGGNGTVYNSSHVGPEYAHIDNEISPGYFTAG